MSTPVTDTPAQAARKPDESIKETFESIVIAFILAFVFRAYVVEAFVIPTGSMAPTLRGQHYRVTCSQCGYNFTADGPDLERRRLDAVCPMCHQPNTIPAGKGKVAGDRILVHKYIYSLSEPRRWDVVVFKAPHDPEINFIKRLVGLPDESVAILEGNIYVQRHHGVDEPPTPWLIARKGDRPKVQEAVWQPVYHTPYVPLDGGDDEASPVRVSHPWQQPWVPAEGEAGRWQERPRQGFLFDGGGEGTLRFDFRAALEGGPGLYAYNHLKGLVLGLHDEPIEDIRLAAVVEPTVNGAGVTLATTARLDTPLGPLPLEASLLPGGGAELTTIDPTTGGKRVLASADRVDVPALAAGRARLVELWYVDQQASLWIDGERVLMWQYDLPHSQTLAESPILTRPGMTRHPEVSLRVASSGAVRVHRIELDRDLYYSSTQPGGATLGRGAIVKHLADGSRGQPMTLAADEFFVLGDNSPQSSDGRWWEPAEDWIVKRMFYAQHPAPDGIVPRKLLIGRAFFVYFPGPYAWGRLPVPNFGQMRFIH